MQLCTIEFETWNISITQQELIEIAELTWLMAATLSYHKEPPLQHSSHTEENRAHTEHDGDGKCIDLEWKQHRSHVIYRTGANICDSIRDHPTPIFLYEFRNVFRQTPRTYEKCNQNHSHCTALHTQKYWEECERSSWWCFVPPLGCIVISFSW